MLFFVGERRICLRELISSIGWRVANNRRLARMARDEMWKTLSSSLGDVEK
jgi:hypothetical protein